MASFQSGNQAGIPDSPNRAASNAAFSAQSTSDLGKLVSDLGTSSITGAAAGLSVAGAISAAFGATAGVPSIIAGLALGAVLSAYLTIRNRERESAARR
jgi:hypothetical protein